MLRYAEDWLFPPSKFSLTFQAAEEAQAGRPSPRRAAASAKGDRHRHGVSTGAAVGEIFEKLPVLLLRAPEKGGSGGDGRNDKWPAGRALQTQFG